MVALTSIAFIGDNSNAIPIREASENKGEYLNTRIMEIDQELWKDDLHKGGNLGSNTFKEIQNEPIPITAEFYKGIQLFSKSLDTQDKLAEHASHVPLKIRIPQELNNKNVVFSAPKWKRLVQRKTLEEQVVLPTTVGKIHVCITCKTYAMKINGFTSFAIDNMYYVNFRI